MRFAMETSTRAGISLAPEQLVPAAEQFLQMLEPGDFRGARASRIAGVRSVALATVAGVVLGMLAYLVYTSGEKSAKARGPSSPSQAQLALLGKRPSVEERLSLLQQDLQGESAEEDEAVGEGDAELQAEDESLPPLKELSGKRRRWLSLARRTAGIERHGGLYRRLLVRGWKRLSAGEYRKASVAFSRAIRMKPQHKDAYYGLALALFEQKLEDVALSVIARAQKRAGAGADIWLLAGSAYQFLGHEKMARKMYEQYLKKEPRGKFARDVKIILAYDHLPALYE